jgi:hypothetical protein
VQGKNCRVRKFPLVKRFNCAKVIDITTTIEINRRLRYKECFPNLERHFHQMGNVHSDIAFVWQEVWHA